MSAASLEFDVIDPLDGDDFSELIAKKESALASLKKVEEALPSLREEARIFIEKGIGKIRARICEVPTGPTMSRYAGGPDALDLSMVEDAAQEAATLASIVTLPKDDAIGLVAPQLQAVMEGMASLEKLTKLMCADGADLNFSGEAAKNVSAKARLMEMIHGKGTLRDIVSKAVDGLKEPPETEALEGFARVFGSPPDSVEEKAQSPEFRQYKKNKGMMTAEQFEKVQAVQVTDGHRFTACMLVQDGGFFIPGDDEFIDAMARLIAVFGEEKAEQRSWITGWLIPEVYILLGRMGG